MPIKQPIGKTATARTLPKPGPTRVQEDEGVETTTVEGAVSKEDAFDNAEPETGFGGPVGNFAAHLVKCGVDRTKSPKESVRFDYEIAEGDDEGKAVVAWYNLFDKDGQPMRGIGFFKRDMEILGQPSFKLAEIDEVLQALEAERPLCNITGKQNGQFYNIYLQGLAQG